MVLSEFSPAEGRVPSIRKHLGVRLELIPLQEGNIHPLTVVSFRSLDKRHLRMVTDELVGEDKPIAFHGWGVTGIAGRVDESSEYRKFWTVKEGRPLGSKIPLLEPPERIVRHVDWSAVHPDFRHLRDHNTLRKFLWGGRLPFHVIFPYNSSRSTLPDVVITPQNDETVAQEVNFPTFCSFWVEDPSTIHLLNKIDKEDSTAKIGVSSLNDHGKEPPYNTEELIQYLKGRARVDFNIAVEDPLLEPLDIASSHSQLQIPLIGEQPVWIMKRRGSLSAFGFERSTGFQVKVAEGAKLASRRGKDSDDLDNKLYSAARLMTQWRTGTFREQIRRWFENAPWVG